MAVKISELATTTTVNGDETTVVVQNGSNKGVALGDIIPGMRRTAAEISAGVTPTNYGYEPGDVRRYGLDTAATAAINVAAVDAAKEVLAQTSGGVIRIPAGTYLWTDWTCDENNVVIEGAGRNVTIFSCDGVATNGVAMLFSKGASSIVRSGVRECGFYKTDSNNKTAVKFNDGRQYYFHHIGINAGNWPGTASVGLHTLGRDFAEFHDCDIECARPWLIGVNPNDTTIDLDLHKVQSIQFATTVSTGICVEAADTVVLSNLRFETCDFAGGKYGFYWNDTASPINSYQIAFISCRWEQGEDATGYDVYLASSARTIQSLRFANCNFDTTKGGAYLRNAEFVGFENCTYTGTGEALNITFVANTHVSFRACLWNTGSSVTLTNSRVLWGLPSSPTMPTFGTGELGYDGNASRTTTTETALAGKSVSIAQDATATIGTTALKGYLVVITDEGASAFYYLNGTGGQTAEVNDSAGVFTITADTASSYNIYSTGGNYVIQNKRTGTHSVRWLLLGAHTV